MIESAGSGVDVDGLMARLRKRVFDIRDRPAGALPINALSLRSNVFINSLEAYTNIADLKTQIRTRWPSNIGATFRLTSHACAMRASRRWPFCSKTNGTSTSR